MSARHPAPVGTPAPSLAREDRRPVVRYGTGEGPVGPLFVAATGRGVCALYLLDDDDPAPGLERLRRVVPGGEPVADGDLARSVLPRVVAHVVDGAPWDDIPLDLRGTPFQARVWAALRSIPRGRTTSYGELACALGLPPGAARAVGGACGANPVSLLVPCHRVVRSGGSLGGYYWGLDRKQALLDLESRPPDA